MVLFYNNSVAYNTSCAASVPSGVVGGEVCQIEKSTCNFFIKIMGIHPIINFTSV